MQENLRTVIAVVVAITFGNLQLAPTASATIVTHTYDWSTATASATGVVLDNDTVAADNNDNWVNLAGNGDGSDDFVRNASQPPFFTGNYYSSALVGSGDDIYIRTNDANFSYAIPATAPSVTMSYLLRINSSHSLVRVGLRGGIGPNPINFGLFGTNLWGYRKVNQDVVTFAATGVALLDSTTRTYRATLTIDLTPVGSIKLADMTVENLTDGGSQTIFSGLSYDLGTVTNPSTWNGLYLRARGSASSNAAVDDLTISYIPEPSAFALATLALMFMRARPASRGD